MRLMIVILNYRTADLTIDCLRSLEQEMRALKDSRVIVVDNDSGDGSAQRLEAAIDSNLWQHWVSVLKAPRNGGYAFGNNVAIRQGLASPDRPDCILLLNPDTIVRPGAIVTLAALMQSRPDVAICGSALESPDGALHHSAHRFPSPLGELDRGARLGMLRRVLGRYFDEAPGGREIKACDWVSGASMMVRREVFEKVGLMDEKYFLYFDEVDFCARAARAGYRSWYVPAARIVHLEGQATGISQARKRRGHWWYESRRRFFVKEYGVPGLLVSDALWAAGRLTFVIRKALGLTRAGGAGDPKLFAYDLLWGDLRALVRGELSSIRREARAS